jgi:hypothetical protein
MNQLPLLTFNYDRDTLVAERVVRSRSSCGPVSGFPTVLRPAKGSLGGGSSRPLLLETLRDSPLHTEVEFAVATVAKRSQVLDGVIAQQAARPDVMSLKAAEASAVLTPPSVTLQHLSAESPVGLRIEPKPRPLGSQ